VEEMGGGAADDVATAVAVAAVTAAPSHDRPSFSCLFHLVCLHQNALGVVVFDVEGYKEGSCRRLRSEFESLLFRSSLVLFWKLKLHKGYRFRSCRPSSGQGMWYVPAVCCLPVNDCV
jgi:hypothetical protein